MTAVSDRPTGTDAEIPMVTATIDDVEVTVPKGTLVIRAAEHIGIQIPRFCDHPLLDPVGACRQCLVEVEGQRKPLASCTTVVTDGMIVRTQQSSEVAEKAQRGVMELLLINHPLDCPVCDKGGECPLQNQAMSAGRAQSRFTGEKRTYTKPVALSSEVLLDRERCVLCARCTRFAGQVAGDPLIDLADRGALQQVSAYADEPFESYFSGNTVQICPVGALTGTAYRFRARPFDLVSTPSACEHCASGCAQRTDHRRGKVLRRLAGDDPDVNLEWNCDKGRWAFTYTNAGDRITAPMVRDATGTLREVPWAQALSTAAALMAPLRGRVGVLTGGRVSVEDAYAYGRFARTVLDTNDIDFRARPHSTEEMDFLSATVAGQGISMTYDELVVAPAVLMVGFEPEEESPMVFLRMRRAVRTAGQRVYSIAPWASPGVRKLSAELLACAPGNEPAVLNAVTTSDLLLTPGSVIVVGERLATVPGALSAAVRLAERTGAGLAWIPRRAGERGALDVGAAPTLLPGGRPVEDTTARTDLAVAWHVADLPTQAGRDTAAILRAVRTGELGGVVVGGVDPDDLVEPAEARAALAAAGVVISLEMRHSAVTELADVVFPVAAVAEKSGTFVDWEGRPRSFAQALSDHHQLADHRVLTALGRQMGIDIDCDTAESVLTQLREIGPWRGRRPSAPTETAQPPARPGRGEAILATWRMLLDLGQLQDGEPHLAGTARRPVVRVSSDTAAENGLSDDDLVRVSTSLGAITLPVEVTEMADRVVWVPTNSPGSQVYRMLGVTAGSVVTIARSEAEQ